MEELYEITRTEIICGELGHSIKAMTALDSIPPVDVGERLRIARIEADITQQDAAEAIKIARTTLVAIEKGDRRVRINELQQLAKRYGISVNALLREEAVHVDLAPRFRKLVSSTDDAAIEAAQLLASLVKAEVELENLLGIERTKDYPPQRPILRGDVRAQAEQDALELRQRLGLGVSPISNIVSMLELELGVRVFVRPFNSQISGLFAFDKVLGPCMLLNANHPRERRVQTAAHECGHFISSREQLEILYIDETINSREERYANAFGPAFLTPPRAVKQKFYFVTAGTDKLSRRHVIILAHYFGVSREAMVRRLEDLSLTKKGSWDWFQANGGITNVQAQKVLGDLATPDIHKADAERPTTLRLNMLAAEAYRQELLSEGQLARLLHLNRIELRGILSGLEVEGSEANGVPQVFE